MSSPFARRRRGSASEAVADSSRPASPEPAGKGERLAGTASQPPREGPHRAVLLATVVAFSAALAGGGAALRRSSHGRPLSEACPAPDAGSWLRVTPAHVEAAQLAACITFAVAFFVSATIFSWSVNVVKRRLALTVSAINWVAFATYAAGLAGYAPAMVARAPGPPMQPFRLLQWACTTPLLIFALSCVGGNDTRKAAPLLRTAVLCDLAMLACGFGERYGAPPGRAAHFAASSLCFVGALRPMAQLFRLAERALSAPEDGARLATLWRHTLTAWCCFPVARLAAIGGLLGPCGEEVAMACLDVAAKTGYCIVLTAGTFTLVDAVTERRLARVEELLATMRAQDSGAQLAAGVTRAYREAEAWRAERAARLEAVGVPEATAAAFLDAAVGEYVALAQGRLDAFGLPTLRRAAA